MCYLFVRMCIRLLDDSTLQSAYVTVRYFLPEPEESFSGFVLFLDSETPSIDKGSGVLKTCDTVPVGKHWDTMGILSIAYQYNFCCS